MFGFYVVINQVFFGTRVRGMDVGDARGARARRRAAADDRRPRRIPAGGFSTRRARGRSTSSSATLGFAPATASAPTGRCDRTSRAGVPQALRLAGLHHRRRAAVGHDLALLSCSIGIRASTWRGRVTPEPKFFLVDRSVREGTAVLLGYLVRRRGRRDGSPARRARTISRAPRRPGGSPAICRDVKLIFILREPADRAYSELPLDADERARDRGLQDGAARSKSEREQDAAGAYAKFARPFSYFSRGLYAELLAAVFRAVSARADPDRSGSRTSSTAREHLARRLHRFPRRQSAPPDVRGLGVINPSEKSGETIDERHPPRAAGALCRAEPPSRGAARSGFRAVVEVEADPLVAVRIASVGNRPRAAWAKGCTSVCLASVLDRTGWRGAIASNGDLRRPARPGVDFGE